MAIKEREQGIAADIRELRGLAIDLVSRVGRLEGQMKVIVALMLVLIALAVTILVRVW